MSAEQTPDIAALAAEVISEAMYEAVMEATADHWRQWYFLNDAAKARYRAEGSRVITQALAPVLAAAVHEAEQRAWDEGADTIARIFVENVEVIPKMRGLGALPANPYRADRITEPVSHEAATSGEEASKA